VFAAIMRTAVLDGRIPRIPCTVIRPPEPPPTTVRSLGPEQVRALAAAMHPRYALTVLIAYGTGARQGETFAASRSRIDPGGGTLIIDRQITLIHTNPNGCSAKPTLTPPKTTASYP